jgi:two-component system sensor histidine kinase YesM
MALWARNYIGLIQSRFIIFFLVTVAFIGVVTWQGHKYFLVVSMRDEENEYMRTLSEQLAVSVREGKETYASFLIQLSYNRVFAKRLSPDHETYYDVWVAAEEIQYLLKDQMSMLPGIDNIAVYHTNETMCEDGRYIFRSDGSALSGFIKWVPDIADNQEIKTQIPHMYSGRSAYVRMLVDMPRAFGAYLDSDIASCAVYSNDGGLIVASGEGRLARNAEVCASLIAGEVFREKPEVLLLKTVIDQDWQLVLEYPATAYSSTRQRGGAIIFAALTAYAAIAGVLMASYLRGLFARIYRIGKSMDEVSSKDFPLLKYLDGNDEISRLESQYNEMLKRLDNAIEEMAQVKTAKQALEIKALESQINPHFLYNTLGAMRWKALDANNKELCDVIDNMTQFYRLSLSKGKGFITVEQEIQLIEAYIAVQQLRYDNCVECAVEIDESARQVEIPKMILQPLIENIYMHSGIVLDGNRKISVSIRRDNETLRIRVRDNGGGMDTATLRNVNSNINLSKDRGMGISFIYNSLKLYYGDKALLSFESALGKGTQVSIDLPVSVK